MLEFEDFCDRVMEALQIEPPPTYETWTDLYDGLGLDSFQSFQLIVVVESLAGADVPPPDLPVMFTLGDAHRYYEQLVQAQGDGSSTP